MAQLRGSGYGWRWNWCDSLCLYAHGFGTGKSIGQSLWYKMQKGNFCLKFILQRCLIYFIGIFPMDLSDSQKLRMVRRRFERR